jgi:hypothetical protein
MTLDMTKQPIVSSVKEGMRVTIFLEGNESAAWKKDYDEAAHNNAVVARAVNDVHPWGIEVIIGDPAVAEEALDSAVAVLDEANRAWADRERQARDIGSKVGEWWDRHRNPMPPG